MKKKLVIGNWKMYKTAHEAAECVHALAQFPVWLAVPFTALSAAAIAAKKTKIQIGAQNLHEAREGAFTGEISAGMLKEVGASFVLIGHSERRTLFGETDERVHKKVFRALEEGLTPVLCVGETLQERQAGKEASVLQAQLETALKGVDLDRIVVAYEPVWAIGTGQSATAEMAQEAHAVCRALLGKNTPLLYGGSVNIENVEAFVAQPDIDGVLVGGASLDPKIFAQIAMKVLL